MVVEVYGACFTKLFGRRHDSIRDNWTQVIVSKLFKGEIRIKYASKLVEELLGVDLNIQKEEFSYAYLYAVISAAGYSFQKSSRPTDVGGIDIIISGIETEYSLYPPRLEIQVKSTSTDVVSEELIRYPLKLKNYNELRKSKTLSPRLLIVVLIPENPNSWIQQSEAELCLRHCAYWMLLQGMPETPNTDNITIYIPRQQIFTIDTLKTLMQRIETGGAL